jgi:hypothetical protein
MRVIRTRCQGCGEQHNFVRIGNNEPIAFECRGCGNIQRGPHCPDCGCTKIFLRRPYVYHDKCRACGSGKEPVWEES